MDPNEIAERLRVLAIFLSNAEDKTQPDSVMLTNEMVNLYNRLDGWLRAGGALPKVWR